MQQVRHVQTWWWNEKSKFKAWCQAKGTAAEKAVLKEYVAAKKIAKKVGEKVGEKEIRRKAQHRRRAEICVQYSKANGKGKAGYGWSELPKG